VHAFIASQTDHCNTVWHYMAPFLLALVGCRQC